MGKNVYEDLGYQDWEEMTKKADYSFLVEAVIAKKGLSHEEVPEMAGISVVELESILRGRFRDISLEDLHAKFGSL